MHLVLSFYLGSRLSLLMSTHIDADNKNSERTFFGAKQTKIDVEIHQRKMFFEDHPTHEYRARSNIATKPG